MKAKALRRTGVGLFLALSLASALATVEAVQESAPPAATADAACLALTRLRNLTITHASLEVLGNSAERYCYVKGTIGPAIQYHVQLPLGEKWNGRFLMLGDGGKDGDLDYADARVAEGYAVANSNTGHDSGSEPGASFAFNNRQAEIDFGYRAVHLTVNAAKTIVNAYYSKPATRAYFEGCSQGGRQGLMEAQRYPDDFDGIVAGAPVNFYQQHTAAKVWMLQRVFMNNLAGNLAFDTNGDRLPDSLTKVEMLRTAVLAKCDAADGITDGVIDDPTRCNFKPDIDLADLMCPDDANADACFTRAQVRMIKEIYAGPHDSKGARVFKGQALGSERGWPASFIPHAGNKLTPGSVILAADNINYLFYEHDPGVTMSDLTDLSKTPNTKVNPPEFAWWQFNIDDVTAGKGEFMMGITDATDPDLTRFLEDRRGKLILYHGWSDAQAHPEPTLDHYNHSVAQTFQGNVEEARNHVRLFMAPGMAHCGGGVGPHAWDRLAPLVAWVENGKAPDYVVAAHRTGDKVDNERKICAYPQRAVYAGPAGGQNDPTNWVEQNFVCR